VSAVRLLLLAAVFSGALSAHIGSPDVFFQGKAGPYPLQVAIRPPDAIPGIARIEVRALSPDVREIQLTPTPMTGIAATHPPVADIAQRSHDDPQFFEGSLWLMGTGSWEVHIRVSGASGTGELPVPVPAVALRIKPMQRGVTYFLIGMLVFLTVGLVAIVGAAVRDEQKVAAMACASIVLALAIWRGGVWWGQDALSSRQRLYRPLVISLSLNTPGQMELRIKDPGWLPLRKLDDLIPDHGHLMHLFLVRWPGRNREMPDRIFHLHPEQTAPGFFAASLPSLPGGTYRIYGDIVHESGFAETAIGETTLPDVEGKPLSGDDAGGPSLPGGGYDMIRVEQTKPIAARQLHLFSFEIVGPDGKPVDDLEPYMGMGGHAEFIKEDGSVFAHVHPTGSVPMASVAVASTAAMMAMHETKPGAVVSFPYGVPTPGKYRIFVQMKRAGKVETGGFEFIASEPATRAKH
jgi:hypothetical protein